MGFYLSGFLGEEKKYPAYGGTRVTIPRLSVHSCCRYTEKAVRLQADTFTDEISGVVATCVGVHCTLGSFCFLKIEKICLSSTVVGTA